LGLRDNPIIFNTGFKEHKVLDMNLLNQKLFIPYDELVIPIKDPNSKKNLCFYFYGENVNLLETYNFLNFKKQYARYVFVPTITRPISYLTPEYTKLIKDRDLLPIKGRPGEYTKVNGYNFFYDATRYLNAVDLMYRTKRFDTGQGSKLYNQYLETASEIDKDKFETILLYAVNVDKPLSDKLFYKKCYIFFNMLLMLEAGKRESIPFEKIIMFVYNKDGGRFVKLYDVLAKNNSLVRVKNILLRLQQNTDGVTGESNHAEEVAQIATKESPLVSKQHEQIVQDAIKNYTKADSTIDREKDFENHNKLITRSVVYSVMGDLEKAKEISKKIDRKSPEKQAEIINKLVTQLLKRDPAKNFSTNMIIKSADVPKLLDYQSPAHILNKRMTDFRVNLKDDISDAFKLLEDKDVPLKLKSMEVKQVHTGASEIYQSIKERYQIQLKDPEGNIHEVHVDLPYLTANGTFVINGQQKILVNQIVRYPIFYPTINVGRFESSYSIMKIHSKFLQNGAYLIGYMGSYKFPLLMVLAYKWGLKESLKDYGVTYTIA
jgi:tetratricopeptide (TPR) repeat protein